MSDITEGMIVIIIALVPVLIGIGVVTREIIKQKKRELFYLLGIMCSICLSYIAGIMVHLTLSPVWKIFNVIHYIPISIFSILIFDILKRESFEPWKLGITFFLSGILLYETLQPEVFSPYQYSNGEWFLGANQIIQIMNIVLLIWATSLFLYYAIVLILKSPPQLKKHGFHFLFSIILMVLGPMLKYLPANLNIFPHIDTIPISLGFLIFAYVFSKHPELFYILPFKVYRLTVLDLDSGISLYDFVWKHDDHSLPQSVYSGFLQGIRICVKESLDQGEIREIKTKTGVFIFEIDSAKNLAFILVSSISSKLLKYSLKRFKEQFLHQNAQFLQQRSEIALFQGADTIIDKIFYFLSWMS